MPNHLGLTRLVISPGFNHLQHLQPGQNHEVPGSTRLLRPGFISMLMIMSFKNWKVNWLHLFFSVFGFNLQVKSVQDMD